MLEPCPCTECGQGVEREIVEDYTETNAEGRAMTVPNVTLWRCDNCGATFLPPKSCSQITSFLIESLTCPWGWKFSPEPKFIMTKLSTHTKGPWRIHPTKAQIEDSEGVPVCGLLWPTEHRSQSETKANARLIAAAPDLLAAMLHLLEWEDARAAVKKALGN